MKFFAWIILAVLLMSGLDAQAARLGGGRSVGKQSGNVTQREAPAGSPSQNVGNTAAAKPGAAAPPSAPQRPWGAMLGGLAAGLGLAWLAHTLGFGEAFGQVLMFALLGMAVVVAVAWFMRRRAGAQLAQSGPFAFQGAGTAQITQRAAYRPENVGNDASARPWERSGSMPFDTAAAPAGSAIGSALSGAAGWGVPEGFDSAGFLAAAKTNFVTLQAAWDRSDIPALRAMMTDSMLKEIQSQLSERESHTGAKVNVTDVVMVEAHLIGIEELKDEYMASVEFSGMIREDPSAGPNPFREVWNMTKAKDGASGWLVAGVQALQ
ncbi:MAG: 39S ribosomal protein L45 [Rhodoferax sp.]|nr:39S ribosomal protein L45 [Rhodoferax sp.]